MNALANRRLRIVVVDDDRELQDRLDQLLGDVYELTFTADWAELSKVFFRGGCDLVLMDVNLPVLKGDKLVQILSSTKRIDHNAPRPKLVYFSAEDESTLARMAVETGADGYVSKSLRGPELLKAIAKFAAS